jgi:ADP-ribose pyrophosphatase
VKTRPAKVLERRKIYQGRVVRLDVDKVVEPSGLHATREVVKHAGSAVVLPVFSDGRILMIRQYRYAAKDYLWELVAGHVERGEKVLRTAQRELAEEAGCTARKWTEMCSFFPSPGLSTELMTVFLAQGITQGTATPEDDERIRVRRFSLSVVDGMIRRGLVRDGKTIAAILLYGRFFR